MRKISVKLADMDTENLDRKNCPTKQNCLQRAEIYLKKYRLTETLKYNPCPALAL